MRKESKIPPTPLYKVGCVMCFYKVGSLDVKKKEINIKGVML